MKVADIALAVLIQLCVLSVTEVAGGKLRHHRRRHGGHGGHVRGRPRLQRVRVGRQEELDTTSPPTTNLLTTTSPAPVERYDLTSYGDYDDSQPPPLSYGAPPPQEDIQDVYVGDIPADETVILAEEDNDGSGIFDNYDDTLVVAASDTGEDGDGDYEEDQEDQEDQDDDEEEVEEEGSGISSSRSDAVPAWCDPTHPMGAWLNYFNIQVTPAQPTLLTIITIISPPGMVSQSRLHRAQSVRWGRGQGPPGQHHGPGAGGDGGGGGGVRPQ